MKINMNMGLKGYYRIVVSKDAEMKEIVQDTGFFENMITDAGIHKLLQETATVNQGDNSRVAFWNSFFREIQVGGGTTAPKSSDTSLELMYVSGGLSSREPAGMPAATLNFGEYKGVELSKAFAKGEVVGVISELGVYAGSSSPVLFSRALVLNDNGVPQGITVTGGDHLTIFYKVCQYVPFPKTFNITADIDGTPTPMEVRVQPWGPAGQGGVHIYFDLHQGRLTGSMIACNAWNSTVDDFQANLTSQVGRIKQLSFIDYDAVNKPFESWGKLVLGENDWNGTIKTVTIMGLPGSWQLRFTPSIVKNFGEKMEIEFGVRLGRYEGSQGLDDN